MKLRRRSLLSVVPATIGGWVLARLGFGGNDVDKLLRVLGDPGKARSLGEACLRTIGDPSTRAIAATLPSEGVFRAYVRDDFAAGRILLVEGWVLSATEARLYALAASTK